MNKGIFTFDEAISLFHVGAYGFKFQSQRSDTFTSKLEPQADGMVRLVVVPVTEEEETE